MTRRPLRRRTGSKRSGLAPLPGRTEDTSATYERCLTKLIDLLGAQCPALTADTGLARFEWQHQARRVIAEAQVPLTDCAGSRTPTPQSKAEYDAYADLRREWRDTALRVFVANEDLDVRRGILPGLDLRAENYPDGLRATVAEAIRIARTHPDEYLRHRVERQV